MQKHVNLVDLVKSFPTNIFLQNLASIQKRTSPIKFAHLAEKSENGSISNLSTKAATLAAGCAGGCTARCGWSLQGSSHGIRTTHRNYYDAVSSHGIGTTHRNNY